MLDWAITTTVESDHRPHPNHTRELVNQGLVAKHDFIVLAILDKLQSIIRYQLPWLKIYNIWLLLSSLFFNVSSAMCGRNQRGGLLYLGIPTLWLFFFLMAKEGGWSDHCDSPPECNHRSTSATECWIEPYLLWSRMAIDLILTPRES